MADVELILLQRVEKLGQMGDLVKVRPGFARNYLLPQKKALRASKDNLARFEQERAQLEAQNLKRREEAERVAERVTGLSVVIIRQAGKSGSLYGSVSARDVAEATTAAGLTIDRRRCCWSTRSRRWVSHGCAWRCIPRYRSRSSSTSRAARKRRSGRHAVKGSAPKRRRTRSSWRPPRSSSRRGAGAAAGLIPPSVG